MKVDVIFFGSFSEKTGTNKVVVESIIDLDDLMTKLNAAHPYLNEAVFITAVNQEIVRENVSLKDGDEIALMPPFAGG